MLGTYDIGIIHSASRIFNMAYEITQIKAVIINMKAVNWYQGHNNVF